MVTLTEAFGISDCVKINAPKSDPYLGTTLDDMTDFAALETRVKKVKPTFIVVDTVGNATDRNLCRQEDAKAFYLPLQVIARRQNIAVFALTHLNAGGKVLGKRVLEKVRTCAVLNAADIKKAGSPRRLEIIKSNSKLPAKALGFEMGDDGNKYGCEPPAAPDVFPPMGEPAKASKVGKPRSPCTVWLESVLKVKPYLTGELISMGETLSYTSGMVFDSLRTLKAKRHRPDGYEWAELATEGKTGD
ncbi:MAG: hypothetical protein C0467_27910 [Planctomycetaceae bacterium]|nr:hypothetical protein [Planctomycetaceae bacterium]